MAEVSGVPPKPCSECRLVSIGHYRSVVLGGVRKGHHFISMERLDLLDMSSTGWVSDQLHIASLLLDSLPLRVLSLRLG